MPNVNNSASNHSLAFKQSIFCRPFTRSQSWRSRGRHFSTDTPCAIFKLWDPRPSKGLRFGPLKAPPMGLGTWAWGNQLLWGYEEEMDAELQQLFNYAISKNVNLFDTADSYGTGRLNGRSEQLLGKFIAESPAKGGEVLIATKLAAYPWRVTPGQYIKACRSAYYSCKNISQLVWHAHGDWESNGSSFLLVCHFQNGCLGRPHPGWPNIVGTSWCWAYELVWASLKRLGQEQLALGQLHWSVAKYAPPLERALWDGLVSMYEEGLVKAVGVSNYGPRQLEKIHKYLSDRGVPLASAQVQFSLLSKGPQQQDIKDVCQGLGIQLIAYSPLGLGMLTGKYDAEEGRLPKGPRALLFRQILPGAQPLLRTMGAIADERGKSVSQVAINWCISQGTIPIPGAKNLKHAKDNIGSLSWSLKQAEVDELSRLADDVPKAMVQNIFQTA